MMSSSAATAAIAMAVDVPPGPAATPPANDPEAPPGDAPFDPLALRRAFGSFGTGVTVVSTLGAGGRLVGVTANSFSSVSLDPPLVLWSLNQRSPSLAAFDGCGRFVVNVLALDQAAISRRFASSQLDKFEGVAFQRGIAGLPVIDDCAATFECRIEQRLPVGDHILFIGRVEAFAQHRRAGLLYVQGHYAQGASLDATVIPPSPPEASP